MSGATLFGSFPLQFSQRGSAKLMASPSSKSESGLGAKSAETSSEPISATPDDDRVESLQKENEDLRRNSQYRSLFLSRLAHELRTPLTSIMGFSEILLNQEKLTEAQRSFCERIQSSALQLQTSLNQLSDLARLEAGKAKLAREEFSLAEALRETVQAVARRAEKKRINVVCDAPDTLPVLTSDRGRLRQVIYNLLAYAITRSPERDSVKASAEATVEGLALVISDKGDPVTNPSEIGVLDSNNEEVGTGELGLAIARQNIQMLGGQISARNLDVGLEVRIDLPLCLPQELQA